MISTRIRDTPYKEQLASLEEGTIVKVRGNLYYMMIIQNLQYFYQVELV